MRLSRLTAVAAVLVPASVSPPLARAQQPIRVARHEPADTARSGDVITISFDRPVAGSIERSANPARFVRIDPLLPATVEWRDVVTLRVIPHEPLPPGRRYRITVDTSLLSLDGGRLQAPYQFTIQTRGPRLLGSQPALWTQYPTGLDPRGVVRLVYSAPVDDARLDEIARLEIAASATCAPQVIRYAARSQRALSDSDDYGLQNAGGWDYGGDRRFKRLVVLRPEAPPPEGCNGTFVLPSFDPTDRDEIRYPMSSAGRFTVALLQCGSVDCGSSTRLTLSFTAPVRRDSLVGRIHIDPQTPFTIDELDAPSLVWTLRLTLEPRTTYRVTIDSTVRDVYGRSLIGPTTRSVYVADRAPGFGHQLGFFTLSREHAVLRVTHVNIDSATIAVIPIPESIRPAVIAALGNQDSVARMVSRLKDTVMLTVTLHAPVNREQVTEIPIPRALLRRHPGGLFAIRARALGFPPADRDSATVSRDRNRATRVLPTIRVIARNEELTNRVALVQVTNLAAHARLSDVSGAVFVTDINTGAPVAGARVVVSDGQGHVAGTGRTDSTGVASVRTSPDWHPVVLQLPDAEWWDDDDWALGARNPAGMRIVEVVRGNDRSVTEVGSHDDYESVTYAPRSLDRSFGGAHEVRAMVYTDRAIYRPGERVYIGSIARVGWLGALRRLPAGDSVRIRVAAIREGRSDPDVVRDTIVRLTEFGTASDSFALGNALPLGEYRVRLDMMSASGWWPRAHGTFRVAEYRAPQFRASLALDSTVRFLGDTIHGHVAASYYFGAAMAGAVVRWSAYTTRGDGQVEIPGLPSRFVVATRFGYGPETPYDGGRAAGIDTLDANGAVDLAAPSVRGSLVGPARVDVQIAVEDVDRQTVVDERSAMLHSSGFYIAVRDSVHSWYWKQDERRTVEVLAVRPDGRHVRDARIVATIIRHHSALVNRMDSAEPSWRWVSDTVGRDSIVSTDSIVRFRVTPAKDGSYEVLLTARDEQGRPVSTSIGAYVIPARWFGGWGLSPSTIAIRLARDTVAPGESARVSFISPFARAQAWVTVAREGMLAEYRRTVRQGETTVAIPVDERFIPGAAVSVLLVDSSAAWQTDSVHRRIRTGEVSLAVDYSSKAIRVDVESRATRYAPGDSVRLTVRLRDRRGRPIAGQVVLWAVDESVLALTDSASLSPLDSMYAPRASSLQFASTASTMASLGRLLSPPGWTTYLGMRSVMALSSMAVTSTGTRSTVGEIIPRTDFRTTAFYIASLVTDANGIVSTSAKLPDNLTTYRITAVAVAADDMFGAAELPMVVTKPLIARAALPRFVRTGDEFSAGTAITNQTGTAVAATVSASAIGVTLKSGGVTDRSLPNGASSEVRFDWRASALPGDTAQVRFAVSGGAVGDAVETPVPVRAPYSPRFHAIAGVTRGDGVVRMMLPADIDPTRSRLTLRVGTTPVPTIRAAYDQLRVYPYLCTEQLTSTGRAIVAMLRLQGAGLIDSLSEPRVSTLRDRLQFVVDELARRQGLDGGVGYWTYSGWTTPTLTGYAGTLLLDARDIGASVRPIVIEGIAEYLRESLAGSPALPDTIFGNRAERNRAIASHLAARLAALHFLRRAGWPDAVREDELVTAQRQMVWQDRVWLAALLSRRANPAAARELLTSVWRDVEVAGTRVDVPDSLFDTFGFRSHVRPIARLLAATLSIEPNHPRLAQLVETVVQQGGVTNGWLWNTQDYAAAADALVQVTLWQRSMAPAGEVVVRSGRRGGPARVLLTGVAGTGANSNERSSLDGLIERDGEWTVLPLRIEGGGTPVFYTLTVEEVPLDPPTTPDAKGIVVERWYERFDDGRPVTTVKEGELVRARLRITVPSDREFVAVADPLPSGLEVVDLSLRTSRTMGPFETGESEAAQAAGDRAAGSSPRGYFGSWYGGWWSPWEHHEIRDDRVVYFARTLWKGTYTASYVARAVTAGTFVRPPAHAEEMYNESLGGRSDGGMFRIVPR